MDHEFELAFNLLDEAAGRLQDQQYGITAITSHPHWPARLTTVHRYTRETGHHLVLLATDDYGAMAAVEATAPDLQTEPLTRITTIRAGDLTFHHVPGTWSFRTTTRGHTYILTAGIGDDTPWTVTADATDPTPYRDLDDAVTAILSARPLPH